MQLKTFLIVLLLVSVGLPRSEASPTCNAGANTSCYHLSFNSLLAGVIGAGDLEVYMTHPDTVSRSGSIFRIGIGVFSPAITSPVITYTAGGTSGCTTSAFTTTAISTTQTFQGWGDTQVTMTSGQCSGYIEVKVVGGAVATTVADMLLPFSVYSNEPNDHLCSITDNTCSTPTVNVDAETRWCANSVFGAACNVPISGSVTFECGASGTTISGIGSSSCLNPQIDNLNRLCAASTWGASCTTPTVNLGGQIAVNVCSSHLGQCNGLYLNGSFVESGTLHQIIDSWPTLLSKIISGNQTICLVTSPNGCGSAVSFNAVNSGTLNVVNSGGQSISVTSWPQLQAVLSGQIAVNVCSSHLGQCNGIYVNGTINNVNSGSITTPSHITIDSWPSLTSSVTESGTLNVVNSGSQAFSISSWPTLLSKIVSGNQTICLVTSTGGCGSAVNLNNAVTGSLAVTNSGGQTISVSSWPQLQAVLSGTIGVSQSGSWNVGVTGSLVESGTLHQVIDAWPTLNAAVNNSGSITVHNANQNITITSWPTLLQKVIAGNQTLCIVTSTGGCGSEVDLHSIESGSLAVTNSGGQTITIDSWPDLQAYLHSDCGVTNHCKVDLFNGEGSSGGNMTVQGSSFNQTITQTPTTFQQITGLTGLEFIALLGFMFVCIYVWSRSQDWMIQFVAGLFTMIPGVIFISLWAVTHWDVGMFLAIASFLLGLYLLLRTSLDLITGRKDEPKVQT
jgi:hypothetical protein